MEGGVDGPSPVGTVLSLSKSVAKVAAQLEHHIGSREATPQGLAIRCQATDALEGFPPTLGVEE